MTSTKITRPRGRPRRFDPDEAGATAGRLFHARGYDAVAVTDVTEALGIKPPSFYAAFGSKLGLYARVLEFYAQAGAIPFADILRPDRPVVQCLKDLLEEAARRYAADPAIAGCLVVEGARCDDAEAREITRAHNIAAEETIRAYIAASHPEKADCLTDFIATTLFGLSAKARCGHSPERLLDTARMAGSAVEQALAT